MYILTVRIAPLRLKPPAVALLIRDTGRRSYHILSRLRSPFIIFSICRGFNRMAPRSAAGNERTRCEFDSRSPRKSMLLFPPNAASWNRFARTLVRVRELHHCARDQRQARARTSREALLSRGSYCYRYSLLRQ